MRYVPVASPAYIERHLPDGFTAALWPRRRRWRGIATTHCRTCWCASFFVATSPAGALRADGGGLRSGGAGGPGVGHVPGAARRARLADGSFVRISDVHLDVPLFWQCWKLDSPIVGRVTEVIRLAAADLHHPKTGQS